MRGSASVLRVMIYEAMSQRENYLCESPTFVVLLDSTAPPAGVVELVDVLINDIPDPWNGKRELDLRVDNGVEE